jgi:hypothetical protein
MSSAIVASKRGAQEHRTLEVLNWLAFAVHLFDGAVGLKLVETGDPRVAVVQPLVEFVQNGTTSGLFLAPAPRTLFTASVLRPLVAVEFITAGFHLVYLLQLNSADFRDLVARWVGGGGLNPLRWVEYAITATLMSAFGALNIGLNSFPYFLSLLSAGVALQVIGFVIELLDKNSARDAALFSLLWMQGTLLNLTNVGVLLFQLFASKTHTDVFYYNVLPFAVLFNTFGAVARASFKKWRRFAEDEYTERAYILLSLSTKVAVFWLSFSTFRELIEARGFAPRAGVRWDVVRWFSAVGPLALLALYFGWTLFRGDKPRRRGHPWPSGDGLLLRPRVRSSRPSLVRIAEEASPHHPWLALSRGADGAASCGAGRGGAAVLL